MNDLDHRPLERRQVGTEIRDWLAFCAAEIRHEAAEGMSAVARLTELGLTLPAVAPPAGVYVPAVRSGSYVYTSGQLPMVDGALVATGKTKFVSTEGGYHGKSMGSLSATGREMFRKPFDPMVPGFGHVPYNDAAAVAAAIDADTAGVSFSAP